MKALTIRQPWASLIAAGVKTIETRSWSTKYRGPLAIHAGKRRPGHGEVGDWCFDDCGHDRGWIAPTDGHDGYTGEPIPSIVGDFMPLGAVVATCTLADVIPIVAPGGFVGHTIGVLDPGEDGDPDGLWEWRPPQDGGEAHSTSWHNRTDQLPFGDFTPGRYAWLLTDIAPCDPVPAKGRLGLWDLDLEETP